MIRIEGLGNWGYEGLSEQENTPQLRSDFDALLRKRADLVMRAVQMLAAGHQLSSRKVLG